MTLRPPSSNPPTTADNSYARLVEVLNKEIARGLLDIRRYAEGRKVKTYWILGRLITRFLSAHSSVPHQELYVRLSQDLGTNERTLQQCAQFFREYPKLDSKLFLSWSHYRYLMMIASLPERQQWEKRIIREKLSAQEFFALIQDKKSALVLRPAPAKERDIERGILYAYRLIKVNYVQGDSDALMVDCGFEIRIAPPPASGRIDNTRIVESQKTNEAYELKLSKATAGQIYTYKAMVERVIDGDTLLVNVDVGFGIWCRQRLRLRGIDAPELGTIAGDRAKRWLGKELAACPFIIAKTYKTDKYDRYLVDVFYSDKEAGPQQAAESGRLLNSQSLAMGMAVPWQPQ